MALENKKTYIISDIIQYDNNYSSAISSVGTKVIIKNDSDTTGLKSNCIGIKDDSNMAASLQNNGLILNDEYLGKEAFVNDKTSSQGALNVLIDEIQAASINVTIAIEDFGLSYVNPSTLIQIIFTNKDKEELSGMYYIKKVETTLKFVDIERGTQLNSVTILQLGRKFNDDGSFAK